MYFLQAAAWCFLSMTLVSVTALVHRMSLKNRSHDHLHRHAVSTPFVIADACAKLYHNYRIRVMYGHSA